MEEITVNTIKNTNPFPTKQKRIQPRHSKKQANLKKLVKKRKKKIELKSR